MSEQQVTILPMLNVVKIKAEREKRQLSQDEAAKLAGIGQRQNWNKLESGRQKNCDAKTLAAIAKVLKCSMDELWIRD